MLGWNEDIKKELGGCGTNVKIAHNVVFTNPSDIYLGDNVRIDPFVQISSPLQAGSNIQICTGAILGGRGGIQLSDWTFIGYHSRLFSASEDYSGNGGPVNEYWNPDNIVHIERIVFRKYSGVASNVTVMPGITLPEGCCIGADSFVYRSRYYDRGSYISLEPYSVYVGNPKLKFLKLRNKEKIRYYKG